MWRRVTSLTSWLTLLLGTVQSLSKWLRRNSETIPSFSFSLEESSTPTTGGRLPVNKQVANFTYGNTISPPLLSLTAWVRISRVVSRSHLVPRPHPVFCHLCASGEPGSGTSSKMILYLSSLAMYSQQQPSQPQSRPIPSLMSQPHSIMGNYGPQQNAFPSQPSFSQPSFSQQPPFQLQQSYSQPQAPYSQPPPPSSQLQPLMSQGME